MRLVIALGGNALLQRHEQPDAVVQRDHVRVAARALAPLIAEHDVVLCHGNGPQIGMLAVESDDDPALTSPFPLDTLGAQTQGMIGYWLAQELVNAGTTKPVAVILTQTVVDADDPAFSSPTKFIGPVYTEAEAAARSRERGWQTAADGTGRRRVVPSPEPRRLVELPTIELLATSGTVVVCAGGGGAPVVIDESGLHGIEAVVDKDLTAALLAVNLDADHLVLLTDVDSVKTGFGTPGETSIRRLLVDEIDEMHLPAGSMGPKVEACARFATRTGRPAMIGSLSDAAAVIAGDVGTTVLADAGPVPRAAARPRS